MHSVPRLYKFLEQEAQLAQSLLTSGLQEIAYADLSDYYKGKFYGGAFQLSIGLERIMKLVVVLDYMLKNGYVAPTAKKLKTEYGHDLIGLYEQIKMLPIEANEEAFDEKSADYDTLRLLSDFSKGTRYYNLDNLSTASIRSTGPFVDFDHDDPLLKIVICIESVYRRSCQDYVRERRLQVVLGGYSQKVIGHYSISPLTGGLEMNINNIQTMNFLYYGRGHFNYLVIRYIKYIVGKMEILVNQCHKYELENNLSVHPIVPYLHDFFSIRYTSKSDAIKRKRWV